MYAGRMKRMAEKDFDDIALLVRRFAQALLALPQAVKAQAFDIRLKAGQPVSLCTGDGIFFLKGQGSVTRNFREAEFFCGAEDMREVFLQLCGHSVFSHENEITNGFVLAAGNCRVGICGTAVLEKGEIKNIRDISSMVFRIPREKKGCAAELFRGGIDFSGGLLLVGEPSSGKTTLLRDIVQSLSRGIYGQTRRVAVVDERCEIAGNFDLGPCADVLRGYPKQVGISMALRSLSPELLVCDELSHLELEAVTKALYSGVPLIASVHGAQKNLLKKAAVWEMLENHIFETVVFLSGRGSPGAIEKICGAGELLEAVGRGIGNSKRAAGGNNARTEAEKKRNHAA